jgi:hypothetical protein
MPKVANKLMGRKNTGGYFMSKKIGKLIAMLLVTVITINALPAQAISAVQTSETTFTETFNSLENFLWGDVDGDGRLTLADITHLTNFLIASCRDSFLASRPFFDVSNADVDGNGVVNTTDLTMLRWLMESSGSDIPAGPDLITLHIMPRDITGFPVFPVQIELYVNNIRSVHQTRGLSIPFLIPEGSTVLIIASAEGRRTVSREIINFNSAHAMQTIIFQSDSDPVDPHDPSDPNNPRLFPLSRSAFQSSIFTDNEATPQIYFNFPAMSAHAVVLETTYPTIADNPTIVGKSVFVSIADNVQGGIIVFETSSNYRLHDLIIVRHDPDTKALHPLETTLDSSGRFRANLDGDGHYFVINIEEFLNYLGVDMDAILWSSHSQMTSPFEIENISSISPSALSIGTCGHTFEDYCVDSPVTATDRFTDSELPTAFNTATTGVTGDSENRTHTFVFTGDIQSIDLPPGRYLLEAWGAQGGNDSTSLGGRGGFSRGEITLTDAQTLYIGVGGAGTANTASFSGVASGGFNGGGHRATSGMSGSGGGGATHIAINPGVLSNLDNNRSAVLIVAGGGGGGDRHYHTSGQIAPGGAGGGLEGGTNGVYGSGGTQTAGGVGSVAADGVHSQHGTFGQGGNGHANGLAGGGGGGWFGGGGGFRRPPGYTMPRGNVGAGGSGYVRGNLTNKETIRGDLTMPNPNGGEMLGREGHGFARITALDGAWITLKGGLRVLLDSYPCPNDLYTDTDGDGRLDSEELKFPPVDVNMRDFLAHFLKPSGASAPDVFVKMYDYYSNPAIYDSIDAPDNVGQLHWPMDSMEVTLWFGQLDNLSAVESPGLNIQGTEYSTVHAVADGIVANISGNELQIDFKLDGNIMHATYGNIATNSRLIEGSRVRQGEIIGQMREHRGRYVLEFIMRDSESALVNPAPFFALYGMTDEFLGRPMSNFFTNYANPQGQNFHAFGMEEITCPNTRYAYNLDLEGDEVYLRKLIEVLYHSRNMAADGIDFADVLQWNSNDGTATVTIYDKIFLFIPPDMSEYDALENHHGRMQDVNIQSMGVGFTPAINNPNDDPKNITIIHFVLNRNDRITVLSHVAHVIWEEVLEQLFIDLGLINYFEVGIGYWGNARYKNPQVFVRELEEAIEAVVQLIELIVEIAESDEPIKILLEVLRGVIEEFNLSEVFFENTIWLIENRHMLGDIPNLTREQARELGKRIAKTETEMIDVAIIVYGAVKAAVVAIKSIKARIIAIKAARPGGALYFNNGWSMRPGGAVINGRRYTEHALERMAPNTIAVRAEIERRAIQRALREGLTPGTRQYREYIASQIQPRNIPPSVVENAIRNSTPVPGNRPNTFEHIFENVRVVVNSAGDVITVYRN